MEKASEILAAIGPQFDAVEAFVGSSEAVKVEYKGGKVRASEVQEASGAGLRAIKDGKLGFYSTTDPSDKQKLLEGLKVSTQFGGEAGFEFVAPQSAQLFEGFSQETADMDIGELAEMGQRMAAVIEDKTDRNEVIVDVNLTRTVYEEHLANSSGLDQKDKRSLLQAQLLVQRVRGDDVFMTFAGYSSIAPEEAFQRLTEKLLWKLEMAENLVELETKEGELPVVFTPSGSILLFMSLMLGLNGKNAFRKVSPLSGKVGEAVLDPQLTILDDPFVPNRPGSASHDDEGVPTSRQMLFDKGVLNGYYYDLKSAGEAGVKSSGHGKRSLMSAPQAGLHNPTVRGGEIAFNDLISDIKEGLLVDSVLGMHTNNALVGAFSNTVNVAYKIQNGEIVGRVKDVSIAGNTYELLKNNLVGLSRETDYAFGAVNLPYIRLDKVSTVSKN